jgi:hypothetical protein
MAGKAVAGAAALGGVGGTQGEAAAEAALPRTRRPRAALSPADIAAVVLPHCTSLRWLTYAEQLKGAKRDPTALAKHAELFKASERETMAFANRKIFAPSLAGCRKHNHS